MTLAKSSRNVAADTASLMNAPVRTPACSTRLPDGHLPVVCGVNLVEGHVRDHARASGMSPERVQTVSEAPRVIACWTSSLIGNLGHEVTIA